MLRMIGMSTGIVYWRSVCDRWKVFRINPFSHNTPTLYQTGETPITAVWPLSTLHWIKAKT